MKNPYSQPTFAVRVTLDHLCLLLGSLSTTIEESGVGFSRSDLRQLVSLHERFCILSGTTLDYAFLDGAVVNARNPQNVIVPAPLPSVETDQTAPVISHG